MPKIIHFTHKLHIQVISITIKTCYYSHRSDFHKSDLSPRQFISLMNGTLSFTIHLSANAVINAGLSSYKSRFIYHFMIAHYWERLIFYKWSIENLLYWYLKNRSHYIQLAILLLLHLWLCQYDDKCEFSPYAHLLHVKKRW